MFRAFIYHFSKDNPENPTSSVAITLYLPSVFAEEFSHDPKQLEW